VPLWLQQPFIGPGVNAGDSTLGQAQAIRDGYIPSELIDRCTLPFMYLSAIDSSAKRQ